MIEFETMQLWFATGSRHLYGDETLKTVAATPARSPLNWRRARAFRCALSGEGVAARPDSAGMEDPGV
jgi:L-arabinose isomerase